MLKPALNYIVSLLLLVVPWSAKSAAPKIDMAKYHEEMMELSVAQNLLIPEVPRKKGTAIETRQKEVALALKKRGYDVELMRDRQVIVVTIPASKLFASSSIVLTDESHKYLKPIADMLHTPDMYKVLVVAHSDDTGSEEYLNKMTENRANSVTEWLGSQGVNLNAVVPYGLGTDEPRVNNSSRAGREANRRIEFYLIPGPVMIDNIRNGR